ncbi:MAG: O-antigen ligase family protein [Gammaproteobacteria bacterium]
MEFTDSQLAQLIIGLGVGLVMFVVAYAASEKSIITLLVLMVPFQMINTGYGTLNTVLVYMVGFIFMLRGRLKSFPLLWSALFILFALLLSTSQAHKSTFLDHFFYIVTIAANFVLFYLVYNFVAKSTTHERYGVNLLIGTGTLVLVFSAIKITTGFNPGIAFGISEFATMDNLEGQQRFIGSFAAAGINGAFHAMQLVLLAFVVMYNKKPMARIIIGALFLGNAAFLVATGSRGSFISMVFGIFLLLVLFIRQVGMGRVVALAVGLPMMFLTAAFVIIKFTTYNVLFERLMETEFDGLTPDTRNFSYVLEKIPNKIVLGHGPRMVLPNQEIRRIPGYEPMAWPHNVYFYIAYTTGVLGLVAYLSWFFALTMRYIRAFRYRSESAYLTALPRVGVVIMMMFLVDELKIEFLRFGLADYQQYMFASWAVMLAMADRAFFEGRRDTQLANMKRYDTG